MEEVAISFIKSAMIKNKILVNKSILVYNFRFILIQQGCFLRGMIPIIDFHCDLLSYLEQSGRDCAFDQGARCSIPQLREGGVVLQICAIYVDTDKNSSKKGMLQAEIFKKLPQLYQNSFKHQKDNNIELSSSKVSILPAIENASALCAEDERLEEAFKRIESFFKIAYISLTWNSENRFGGPPGSIHGLKDDGKVLLEFISGKRIAIDLSHASDSLVEDIFNYTDAKKLDVPIIASHSNCRAVANHPRNLPDPYVKEIIRRKGVIGLNFVRDFVSDFRKQIDHFLSLGAEHSLVLGADFFYTEDQNIIHRQPVLGWYFPEFDNAGCYQRWLKRYGIGDKIANQNALNFLKGCIL